MSLPAKGIILRIMRVKQRIKIQNLYYRLYLIWTIHHFHLFLFFFAQICSEIILLYLNIHFLPPFYQI